MTPAQALAAVVVDELVRLGVREVVLAPGSRSAPLAYALHAADAAGRLRLHVRIDERSAAFLALGLAKATGVPAPVVTTSGTAVANLTPAVLEAHEAGIPMLLLTADRPPELRGTRANQTTDQLAFFGRAVRWFHELEVPTPRAGAQAAWRTAMDRAVAAATGITSGDPGPVHVDVPLRDPLAPEVLPASCGPDGSPWPESLDGRPGGGPWTTVNLDRRGGASGELPTSESLPDRAHTLVVLGDGPTALLGAGVEWAARRCHPVIGEPFGPPLTDGAVGRLPHGVRLAGLADHPDLVPDRIVVVGRLTLSRAPARMLGLPGVHVDLVTGDARWADPGHVVDAVHDVGALRIEPGGTSGGSAVSVESQEFRAAWTRAARQVSDEVAGGLAWPSGPALAAAVLDALPEGALLFLGSSNGVRHVDLVRGLHGPDRVEVVASRGLAGIDGCVSTAAGLALGTARPTYALLGDLTFLHDANGLIVGPHEPVPDLTIVVGNDDGGAIFGDLEYGQAARREAFPGVFERTFRTATGTDLAALCRAHGVEHVRAASAQEVAAVLVTAPRGLTVVEVPLPTDRPKDRPKTR